MSVGAMTANTDIHEHLQDILKKLNKNEKDY